VKGVSHGQGRQIGLCVQREKKSKKEKLYEYVPQLTALNQCQNIGSSANISRLVGSGRPTRTCAAITRLF
jgi:hypothetical protein